MPMLHYIAPTSVLQPRLPCLDANPHIALSTARRRAVFAHNVSVDFANVCAASPGPLTLATASFESGEKPKAGAARPSQ